jgi:hypothetical protein
MPVFADAAYYQRSRAVADGGARGGQGGPADPEVVTAQQQVHRVRPAGQSPCRDGHGAAAAQGPLRYLSTL